MSGVHDEGWLQTQLEIITGWDPMMVQGVVEALANMDDPDEIEALIENVLSDTKARQSAEKFLAFKANGSGSHTPTTSQASSTTRHVPSAKPKSKSGAGSQQQSQKQPGKKPIKKAENDDDDDDIGIFVPKAREKLTRQERSAQKQQQPNKQQVARQQAPQQPQQQQQQQTMSINEAMSRPKKGSKKPKGATIVRGEISLAQQLKRKVMNCVQCGKVFDCRKAEEEIYHMLNSGGFCTFCNSKIKLQFSDGSTNWLQEDEEFMRQYLGGEKVAQASLKATNLKNQLVEFDRHSAKRTQVIDDHSDFYEIDSNAWLTDEERQLMRERQKLEEEAAEAKKNKISFTVDLMGRKVMLADKDEPMSFDLDDKKKKLLKVAEANQNVAEQGGGTSIKATLEAARELDKNSRNDENMEPEVITPQRIAPNPTLKGPAPVFLPSGQKTTSMKQKMQSKALERAQTKRKNEWSRIQDDDIFEDFMTEIQVKYEDDNQAFREAHKNQKNNIQDVFDLCDNEEGGGKGKKNVGPAVSPMSLASNQSKVHSEYNRITQVEGPREILDSYDLPQGMVWLKGWMTVRLQTQIVNEVRRLGMGPAGFYQSSFVSGARHNMLMMCLGKHWEVRTGKYEATRSSYDGAIPKPIPQFLQTLAQEALQDAQKVSGFRFNPTKPDVAICNYYPPNKGSLGVHQDVSESPETLKKGLPVISFSFGDIGDFVFGKTREVSLGGNIKLCSGDVLIFGGPSRNIFHGVPKVYQGTAPAEFLKSTRMKPGRLNITFRQSQ